MELLTIGHSNHSIEAFIALLQKHKVTAVADVRSHPYSRYLPHFNQALLKPALLNVEIHYVFLGRELGARSDDPTCYVDGKALYTKIAATKLFSEGIQRILKGAEKYKIVLMCAEKDPIICHRAILVCQHLRKYNINISHILRNSNLETHEQLEERLLKLHGLKQSESDKHMQLSLFNEPSFKEHSITKYSKKEAIVEAYTRQSEEIAYAEKAGNQYDKVG
ncbi:MAG: DUF488 domain-containing protein [Stigonema ocellatum SAG 48.90 = DSM 106950]|nr:DUF488 domain-containing protein [Stigonema ocellatum SAG 48.90 = DSM 106950]